MKDDRFYAIHVVESIARIERYVSAASREAFAASSLVQDAVLRNLQVLAESSQRLSDNLKVRHPEVPWRKIAGFRNVLVHDYLGVDPDRVWEILQNDLPQLKSSMQHILDELPPKPE